MDYTRIIDRALADLGRTCMKENAVPCIAFLCRQPPGKFTLAWEFGDVPKETAILMLEGMLEALRSRK
jgi:hypothetical protein